MAQNYDVQLQTIANGAVVPQIGVWVQLVNNDTGTAYVSTGITSGTGKATFAPKPPGDTYVVNISATSSSGPWTAFGVSNWAVPVVQGENISMQSITGQVTGPYMKAPGILAGETVSAVNPYYAKAAGVMFDGQFVSDGVMNGTTGVLTSASGLFQATDVGKLCLVPLAGPASALLTTTIASYQSATQVTLAAVSSTAVTGALVTWGTDDTTAWVAFLAGLPAAAQVILSRGFSLITNFLGITKDVSFEGQGVTEIWGTWTNSASGQTPSVSPYITGSVIVQCTAATDAIRVTGTSTTFHRKDFGIKFADGIKFLSTGHGIYAVSTATHGAGHETGEASSRVDNIVVFGHDGNHYAYYGVNPLYQTAIHPRSYGGGGFYLETDSDQGNYGNMTIIEPFVALFCGGTANGYTTKAISSNSSTGMLNLLEFVRPQCNISTVPLVFAIGGSGYSGFGAGPTVAQYLWRALGADPVNVGILTPDLEGYAFTSPVLFAAAQTASMWIRGGLVAPYAAVYPNFTFPGDVQLNTGRVIFPAVQNASTNVNTLDDYSENTAGTLTPGVSFGGASVGITYGTQNGYYVKVGRLVMVVGHIVLTAKGSSTGTAKITNLPYSANGGDRLGVVTFGDYQNFSFTAGHWLVGKVDQGAATAGIFEATNTSANSTLTDTHFTATTGFSFMAIYQAAT